jgi:hypothetical protein
MVVVALGEPGTPVMSCADAGKAPTRTRVVDVSNKRSVWFIIAYPWNIEIVSFIAG